MRGAWFVAVAVTAVVCTVGATQAAAPRSGLRTLGGVPRLPIVRGKVAVVLMGKYDGNILPVVIRNGTKTAMADMHLSGRGYSGSKLIITGEDQGVQPDVVPPGGLALAYLFFDQKKLPASTRFRVEVSSTPANRVDFQNRIDLPITTLNRVFDRVVGIARNPLGKKISGPFGVYVACLDAAKHLIKWADGFADKQSASPHESVPFTIDLSNFGTEAAPTCRYTLVSVRGYT